MTTTLKGRAVQYAQKGVSVVPMHAHGKPVIPVQIASIEKSGTVVASPSDSASSPMTTGELISRAKYLIGAGEASRDTSFRAAAEDIACACDQGATQRQVAEGVGKSAAWVNRLLKWREGGYVGAPLADKIVQGVNEQSAAPEPASIDVSSAIAAIVALSKKESIESEGRQEPIKAVEELDPGEAQNEDDITPGLAPATKIPAQASDDDYHIPSGCNRQDPEVAFQRLLKQWPLSPFRGLLLDSPKVAQERFLRDRLLPELAGSEGISLSSSSEGSGQ